MKRVILFSIITLALISCKSNSSRDVITLLSNDGKEASCVFITKDETGNPAVSWAEVDSAKVKHFYLSFWNMKAGDFGQKIEVPVPQNTKFHEEGMPKIAFKSDGSIIATFETSVPVEGARFGTGDIKYAISTDRGKSWTEPVSVQAGYPDGGSIGFSNMLRLDDGEIGIAWLGTGPASVVGRPVMFAKSTKEGGFTKAILIDSVACQCCRIALSTDGNGDVKLAFRNLLPGSVRDISITGSSNNGNSFIQPVSFSGDDWVIDGCPHDGPSIVNNYDNTFAAWYAGSSARENAGVYYAELDKNNNTLTKRMIAARGKFIQLCLMPDGTRIMGYNESYSEGDSIFNKIVIGKINGKGYFIKEMTKPRSQGFYPVVTPVSNDHVVIAWKDRGKIFYRTAAVSDITTELAEEDLKLLDMKNIVGQKMNVTNETDPACGMELINQMAKDTTLKDGKIIGFCSRECKENYLKSL